MTDDYLICTCRFNKILDIRSDPPRITVQPGVTVGQTLRAFMQNGLCFPMNVDLPTLRTGEIRTVRKDRDGDLWNQNLPGIAEKLRSVYGENLETFLQVRNEAGVDPDNIFVNSFLEELLLRTGSAPMPGNFNCTADPV